MKKVLWALIDNRQGSNGQVRGVIAALGNKDYDIFEKPLKYMFLSNLPNWFRGWWILGIDKDSKKSLQKPFPDLVISGSRRTAPIARWIKKKSGGKTKIIQLMHVWGASHFDLVFVPEHDKHKAKYPNFVYVTGTIHRVNEKSLEEAHKIWANKFVHLPKPFTMVIVGGSIKGKPFTLENAAMLGDEIKRIKKETGGSILITSSPRTGSEAEKVIMEKIKGIPNYSYLWGNKDNNPIMGFWAEADNIIATGDSVSMVSESCGTGKPVLIFTGKNWLTSKHMRFVEDLYSKGYAINIENKNALAFKPEKELNEGKMIKENIENML